MKRINVSNIKTGRVFGPMVLDDAQAEALILKHKGNKSTWGREERYIIVSSLEEIPNDAISSEEQEVYLLDEVTGEIVLDEEGMPVVDPDNRQYRVLLPKEYDLSVEDVTSELTIAESWAKLRSERDVILASLDFTQLADAPITSDQKRLYREYRDYLRKLPSQYNDETVVNYKIESFQEWKNRVYPQ